LSATAKRSPQGRAAPRSWARTCHCRRRRGWHKLAEQLFPEPLHKHRQHELLRRAGRR
jgi:hypothetical protein